MDFFAPKEIKGLKTRRDTGGLFKILESSDKKMHKHAIKAIIDLGDKKGIEFHLTNLIMNVENADEKRTLNIMETIENFGNLYSKGLAIVPLLKGLDNPNKNIQDACYAAIINAYTSGGHTVLMMEEAFADESLRINAAKAFASIYLYIIEEEPFMANTIQGRVEKSVQSDIEILSELFDDSPHNVVVGAVLLLARFTGKENAAKVVKEKFEDENVDVEKKKSILLGLNSLGDFGSEIRGELSIRKIVEVEEAIMQSPEAQWLARIEEERERSIDVMKETLVHGDVYSRLEVVERLKEIKDDGVIELAQMALKDKNDEVRERCVDIIDNLQVKDKKVFIKPLIEIVSNHKEKENVRRGAILVLYPDPEISNIIKDIEDEETVIMIVEALKRAEEDENDSIKVAAGVVLEQYESLIDKKIK
ncbi:hypothetical protein KAX35_05480 [candidate division WOR-3 bacterium]|nr:hypothetical protein [candidate division WOR-3 bacterium]